MAESLYDIPVSLANSSAANSSGSFYGGSTQFNFGDGSQDGAPVYQTTSPSVSDPATAAASSGGGASASPGLIGTGAASLGGDLPLIMVGLVLALGAFVLLHKKAA